MRMKRLLIGGGILIAVGMSVLLGSRDMIIAHIFEERIQQLEKRVGEPIHYESVTLGGLDRITLRGLTVGVDRWIYIQRAEIKLNTAHLINDILSGHRPGVQLVTLIQPTVLTGGRHLEESFERQRLRLSRLISKFSKGRGDSSISTPRSQGDDYLKRLQRRLRSLPHVKVIGGKVSGARGGLFIHQ